jgi:hypothetical protein
MIHNRIASLSALVLLIACSEAGTGPTRNDAGGGGNAAEPEHPSDVEQPQVHPGGNSGSEGSLLPCEETDSELATLDTVSPAVGVSGSDLLALANREPEVSLRWPTRDSGPAFDASAPVLMIHVAAMGAATEVRCDDPNFPDQYRPKPRVKLPVVVTLRTAGGALDERFETVLSAESRDRADIEILTVEPEAVSGSIGAAVASFYTSRIRSLVFELSFRPSGTFGWVAGPFSPHASSPCAYTAYAYWPADSACWPERGGEPVDDIDAMKPHLARVNRAFELVWSDAPNERTQATLDVQLADGTTCQNAGETSHPVRVHIVTQDGRADLTLAATLAGGPVSVDPWPAHLRDVEPFYLDLSGSIALDRAALADQLSVSAPNVSAGIVNFSLSSPSGVDSAVLEGELRVAPIDRTGFATALPIGQLPGGDSERCFSSGGTGAPVLRGKIAQR